MQIAIHGEQVEALLTMMLRYHKENIERVEENKKLKETIQSLIKSTSQQQAVQVNPIPDENGQSYEGEPGNNEQFKQSQILFKSQNDKKMINACIRTEKNGYSLYECRICHRIYKSGKQLIKHYEERHSCQEGYFIRTSKKENKEQVI